MTESTTNPVFEARKCRMTGPLPTAKMQLTRAQVDEGLSRITEIGVEYLSETFDNLQDVVGQVITLEVDVEDGSSRYFAGHCIEAEFLGTHQGLSIYRAELRSWPWFMTRTADCRIFQDKTALEIITEIFGDYGFSDYEDKTQGAVTFQRSYCVQYRETDWDFICRLMEEEGLYYHFDYMQGICKLIIIADSGQHQNISVRQEVEFIFKEDASRKRADHIFEWTGRESVTRGKVTLRDFNFQTPSADLTSASTDEKGFHSYKDYEVYDYPGRFGDTERGGSLTGFRMGAYAADHKKWRAAGNHRTLAVGYRFTLKNHPNESENREYLITGARHLIQVEADYDLSEVDEAMVSRGLRFDFRENRDEYTCLFDAIPHDSQFRAPHSTRKPVIPGIQTATVVGPEGDEIYTDAYGRVKIKFHWDREAGERRENCSCWVRKAEPWSGAQWGMQWIPRVGQEVVVLFEEGDPDRPLIVGMLYNNAKTPPPFRANDEGLTAPTLTSQDEDGNSLSSPLPANKNLVGWMSRSTAQGGTTTFHELVFDDTKDSEFVRLQSERDYKQIIKNNAVITIGVEHQDPGDLMHTVQNDVTEDIGNDETVTIGNDQTVTIGNDQTLTVENDRTVDVTNNETVNVGADKTDDVGSNYTITVGSELSITANSKITLTCGGSTIEMTSSKITISSTTVEISGSASASVEGAMTEVKASGMLTLKGGTTMIN